ncbi:phenylalanine 4-monooxygenase [Naegleria gruberi]|uniref:phenylalanine 4-monooxygenase n=1 Tax=Naegleria gruberi TaxID=5762 RepID=D2VZV3_NAEGR|nr:phenylalanine 4-monooxygenase [Naegleria gruberi]EFC37635.1 phenylalanine 4-monooxygenase [Naegleria gruberi]|eukprot:XP_002670379.1 phenylalanine 4-monooxygenase [Naegleria gruberi strain NEG-M]
MSSKYRSLLITLPHRVGALKSSLDTFSKHNINLTKIESKPSKISTRVFNFHVDIDEQASKEDVDSAIKDMIENGKAEKVKFLGGEELPWFPRKISDIDFFTRQTLEAGGDLESDHPGFHDKEYRDRRKMISDIAINYKHGEPIPRIQYTQNENNTWKVVYEKLTELYPKYACEQYNYLFPLFQENCGFRAENIPQLQDVNDFLVEVTGFRYRPVAGLLSARDFLNGLAFRVFHSTQYIRHHSSPFYTPEPDVVHELLGHSIMLADPDFAEFSQQIGLASLGASDADIDRLVRLYWYCLEFGLVKENNELKAYGAGLLSSFGELEFSCTGKDRNGKVPPPEYRNFVPTEAAERSYPITHYQPMYYVVDSLESCKELIKGFTMNNLEKEFVVKYNPYTNTVDVLDSEAKLIALTKTVQNNLDLISTALGKLKKSAEME